MRQEENTAMKWKVFYWIRDLAITLVVVIIVMQFIRPSIVSGSSMENTIHDNDYILISRQAYTFGDHQRGDIVVVRTDLLDTRDRNKHFVKRIIGLPGDRVAISDGKVLVNGKELTEEYTKDGFTVGEMSVRRVPKDKLFVLGDNRQDSLDSRNPVVGFVPNDRVFGKVIFRLFPFNQIGTPE